MRWLYFNNHSILSYIFTSPLGTSNSIRDELMLFSTSRNVLSSLPFLAVNSSWWRRIKKIIGRLAIHGCSSEINLQLNKDPLMRASRLRQSACIPALSFSSYSIPFASRSHWTALKRNGSWRRFQIYGARQKTILIRPVTQRWLSDQHEIFLRRYKQF